MKHYVSINCTDISPRCPVENTIYGYYPSLPLNAFFIAIFSLCALLHVFLGIRAKTWFFAYAVTAGCIGEAIGYGGRIIMHSNPVCQALIPIQVSSLDQGSDTQPTVFLPRIQDSNLVPYLLSRLHRCGNIPHFKTHRHCFRPRT